MPTIALLPGDGTGREVHVDTGDTEAIEGWFTLESKETESGDGEDADTSDGGFDRPWHVYVNTDPVTGDHTGGSVDLVDIKAGTPGSSRPSVKNHLALMKNTAQGVEEVGKSLRLHDLEQAEGHVVPEEDGTRYDLETRFSPVDEQRELLVRQRDDGDTTKVWSDTWPDEADIRVMKPEDMGAVEMGMNFYLQAGGQGGELPEHCADSGTGTTVCRDAWVLHGVAPIGGVRTDFDFTIPEGTVQELKWEVIKEHLVDGTISDLEGFKEATVEAADAAVSAIESKVDSLKEDFNSTLAVSRQETDGCSFQSDLDGVEKWSNQTVVHGHCTGEMVLDHRTEDYSLRWGVGQADPSGSLDDTSIQFKNNSYREGDTTYREATVDTQGDPDYEKPYLRFREEDSEYELPQCMLTGEC
jgi:hypothetical protein